METAILAHPNCKLTLYAISLVRISIILWERSDIQKEIQNYFSDNDEASWNSKTWHMITAKVLHLADGLNSLVPYALPEIKDAILNTGIKMYDWIWYCHSELGLNGEKIFWTPLGFIDEARIYKSWENDASLHEKQKFRLACIFTKEDFINKHKEKITEEFKKLQILKDVHLEDKVYAIISAYLLHHINQFINKKEERNYYWNRHLTTRDFNCLQVLNNIVMEKFDNGKVLRNHLIDRTIAPPDVMVKLCTLSCLLHGTKYYYKKLNDLQKMAARSWIRDYYHEKLQTGFPNHCEAEQLSKIAGWIDRSNDCYLLYLCPLESVIPPIFAERLNIINIYFLEDLIVHDHYLGLSIKRNLFQRLLKQLLMKASRSKISETKEEIIWSLTNMSLRTHDFAILKSYLDDCRFDSADFQWHLSLIDSRIDDGIVKKNFYDAMFDSPNDRAIFFREQFYKLMGKPFLKFESLENVYSAVNIFETPLRDTIDPLKCLSYLYPIQNFDRFIKYWHEAEKDQIILKNMFKESSYLPECIYRVWSWESFDCENFSTELLRRIFKSEEDIIKFEENRLSISDFLNFSLKEKFYHVVENGFYRVIESFINFAGITPDIVIKEKERIRNRMEDIMINNFSVYNISTLIFLMDWVELSEEFRKKIFRELNDSSKMLKVCEEMLHNRTHKSRNNFYNKWLKLYGNVSEIKTNLISIYRSESSEYSEYFILEFSSMYEKLERGEDLADKDFL